MASWRCPGLTAPVRITRDAHGIPTIRAANEHDADFALGFLHAQDRLFAMDMMRRYGAGRLSELFGARTLAIDRTMRTLGLYRAAAAQFAAAVAGGARRARSLCRRRQRLSRNAARCAAARILPPRHRARAVAAGGFAGLGQDHGLAAHRQLPLRAVAGAAACRQLSPADLAVLFPPYPTTAPPAASADTRALYRALPLDRLYALLPPGTGPQAASNNWVVDGAHSQSGKPLLANDPHLDFSAPGVWYLARIETPETTLAGVTAPGTPFMIIGHNAHIAWGFTTTGGDVEDLFIEKPDPGDPSRYLAPGGPRPFVTRTERIGVRGAAPVTITVRTTRHGPVISDLADGKSGEMLALQTTWLGADDRTPQAVWEMSHARDWQSFRAALKDWVAPQQNIVYADAAGHIGFIAPARIPIRASGDGWLPVPGWNGEYDWIGTIPFDALPSAYDPPSGRIVTANNKIVPDDYPYLITRDWEAPYRAERINQLLDAVPRQSPAASAAIQADDLSLPAQQLLPLMLQIAPTDPGARDAVALLKRWDFRMDRGKVEPLLYTAWLRAFERVVLAPRLGPYFDDYWSLRPEVVRLILTAHPDWCVPRCADALATALREALAGLAAATAPTWRAGAGATAHRAAFRSGLWSHVPVAAGWTRLAIAADGGDYTVNAAVMDIRDEAAPFRDVHGPTLRMIVDLADPTTRIS